MARTMSTRTATPQKLAHALRTFQKRCISCRGPFITPDKNYIYVVGGYIVTEPEILALHEQDRLKAEHLSKLLPDLNRPHGSKSLGDSADEL
jgi:hypothetical protein